MRVNGENCYAFTLCNPYYSSFFTRRRKNSETVNQILNEFNLGHSGESGAVQLDGNTPSISLEPNNQLIGNYIKILVAESSQAIS